MSDKRIDKQVERFKEAARELGCDESEERFEKALRKFGRANPEPKKKRKGDKS